MKSIAAIAALTLLTSLSLSSCGAKEFDSSKPIQVITREDGSGTKAAFMEIIGLKGQPDVQNAIIQQGTAAVLAGVKNSMYAIAYDSLGYLTDEVKQISVDGVEGTVENIQSGDYKIARPLNVVYKEATVEGNPLYSAYLDFLASSQAQEIIAENGYVSMREGEEFVVPDNLEGTISISGSTSLQPLMVLLAQEFEDICPKVSVEVNGGGSGVGYSNGENGVSAFGMISEEFAQDKAPSCVPFTVAKDGIGIIVNLGNPIEDISLNDLKTIYDSKAEEPIRSWEEVIG